MPYLGSVATDEMVHGLLLGELADRWQHSKSITAQQDEIFWVWAHTGYPGIGDVVNGVGCTCVLCHSAAATTKHEWRDYCSKVACISGLK